MKQAVLHTVLLLSLQAFLKNGATAQEFLEGSVCHEASDCYINHEAGLSLACYYNVNKCACRNTWQSIYNLNWIGGECLMSKYGPCGANGAVKVGCQAGFQCIEGRCRDPADSSRTIKGVYKFPTGTCSGCRFASDLQLECDWQGGHGGESCKCQKVYIADGVPSLWDIRNYDGNKNCSVGQFGPCGERNGVKIECHGDGIACQDGICTNPAQPLSAQGQPCQENKNCQEGLICSNSRNCIAPGSTQRGGFCSQTQECAAGLECKRGPMTGPWSSAKCLDPKTSFRPTPPTINCLPYCRIG